MEKPSVRSVVTAITVSAAEWLFAMSPLVVVSIIVIHLGKFNRLPESAEWGFGAATLSAQALVRFVGGVARARKTSLERVLLGVALILVGVVGPANVVLGLVLTSEFQYGHVDDGLGMAQIFLFLVSSLLFVILAAASHLWTNMNSSSAVVASDLDG
jgi:hypothetical protein